MSSKLYSKLFTSPETLKVLQPDRFVRVFGADLRSLALLRICIGLLLLVDVIDSSRNVLAFYSDFGVLPRKVLLENLSSRWLVSLHLLNGTWQVQLILLMGAGVAALALCAGYRTQVATFVTWMLFFSLNTRNPLVIQAGDIQLRMILFWGLFLPWGERFSVDRLCSDQSSTRATTTVSMGTLGYLAQIISIYLFGAILKSGPEWRVDGSAVYYALSIDQFATPLAHFLLQFPSLLKLLTFAVYGFEWIAPIALLLPFFVGPFRTAIIAGLILMHISFGACLAIGLFTWIGALSPLGLLPTWFWEKVNQWRDTKPVAKVELHYDHKCMVCRLTVGFVSVILFGNKLRTVPVETTNPLRVERSANESPLLIDDTGNRYNGYAAFIRLVEESRLLRYMTPLLRLSWIEFVLKMTYGAVNHMTLSAHLARGCAHDDGTRRWSSKLSEVIAGMALVYVLLWNLTTLPGRHLTLSERYRLPGEMFGLEQSWEMFAPFPLKDDGWYVIPGRLSNGSTVDLFRDGGEVTWAKPVLVAQTYQDYRWRKYMMNLLLPPNHKYQRNYAEYLCRDWNARHGAAERLEELQLIFVLERTLPNYEYSTPMKVSMMNFPCPTPK